MLRRRNVTFKDGFRLPVACYLDLCRVSCRCPTRPSLCQNILDIRASFEKRVGNGLSEIAGQGRAQPGGAHP